MPTRPITIDRDELRAMIKDAVVIALTEMPELPLCKLQNEQLSKVRNELDRAIVILTGNGTPSNGLVYKFSLIEMDVKRMSAGVWTFAVVGIGLIVTAIWEIITK